MTPVQFAFRSWLAVQGFRWNALPWAARCRVCGGRLFSFPGFRETVAGREVPCEPASYAKEFLEGNPLWANWQSDAMCAAKYESLVCPACLWERKCVQLPKPKRRADGRPVEWSVNFVYELVPPVLDDAGSPVVGEDGRPVRKKEMYPGRLADGRRLAFLTAAETAEVLRGNVEPPFALTIDLTDMKRWFQYAWWYGCEIVFDRRQFVVHADLGVWKGAVVVRPPLFDALYRAAEEGGDVRRESYPLGHLAYLLARRAAATALGGQRKAASASAVA